MGNTCAIPASAAPGAPAARTALIGDAVETILLEGGPAEELAADEASPQRRSSRGRKPTGFAFARPMDEDEDEDEDEGDGPERTDSAVSFAGEVAEVVELEQQEGEETVGLKRTSERKATGKAVRLSPADLEEIHRGAPPEAAEEGAPPPAPAGPGPVLLAAPAPQKRDGDRKPTGRPTEERRQKVRKDTGHPRADGRGTKVRRAFGKLCGA